MRDRIETICSFLPRARVLADVGCDHGFMAKYALQYGLAEKVYISDVSPGSLKKAERLLEREIKEGRCVSVLADGMKGLPPDCDVILIAGLGGEEIVRILSEGYLPETFLLQPMKNAEKVRAYLIRRGAHIERDFTFGEGYYYDLICGRNTGGSAYTPKEILYGRDNLRAPTRSFLQKLEGEREKVQGYLLRDLSERSRAKMERRDLELKEIIDETRTNLQTRR